MPKAEPTMTQAESATALTQPQNKGKLTHYKLGSSNPQSRSVSATHALDALLELKLNDVDLADELVKLCKAGDLGAIKYAYDRVAGKPIERYEAKLLHQVQENAARIAKEHDMTVEEVQAQARQYAQGA